ncbi:MAG TPA: M28 family peptidase [Bryobacteraceae bacterium]|nr:M28 family peptidase [Bryobacteraceae bacterium]
MKATRKFRCGSILIAAALLCTAAKVDLAPQDYLDHIKFLASPDLKGRGTGSPGLEKAAAYIAEDFRSLHLQPLAGDSYYQDFQVTTNAHPGPGNRFSYVEHHRETSLKFEQDFVPFNFSASGKVSGQLVFAGYGITAKEYHYDDYAGLDVKGKLVIVLRHEPQEFDPHSVFEGKVYTAHSQFANKAINAKMHGARGVILINDIYAHGGENDRFESFGSTAGPDNAGILFVQTKAVVVEQWLAEAGKNLKDIEDAIDKDLKPQSFALPADEEAQLNVDIKRDIKTVHNVGAYIPGDTAEYVIIGAHYDHLGLGEKDSLAPALVGTVHPGADDNASGTAGVMELAKYFAGRPKLRRGVLFLTFAGEELGLLGSSYYVNHPELPIENAVAMINMDMIGRIRENKVYVGGVGTGTMLKSFLAQADKHSDLVLDESEKGGYGSSDHTSFTTKQVPVLFFFSGLHGDYHRPSDTWDKIDAPDAVKLLRLVADVTSELASAPERPKYVPVPEPHSDLAASASTGNGYGPYFGSIPDFTELPNGVRFADIHEGSPAAKAGLKAGDILVEFDGKPIQNLYDFTYALRAKKAGDEVLVNVLRNGQRIEAKVLLSERH